MSQWLNAISRSAEDDFSVIANAIDFFDNYHETIRRELDIKGRRITEIGWKIAGLSETVLVSWAEIKAICEIIDLRKLSAQGKARKHYIEHYNRDLSVGQIEKYAEVEPNVLVIAEISVQMNFILNKWEALSKSVERMHYQLKLIGDLKLAGMEDATII